MTKILELALPEHMTQIQDYLEKGIFPDGWDKNQKRALRRKCANLHLIKGNIFFIKPDGLRLRVMFGFQTEQINQILSEEHGEIHLGVTKLAWAVNLKYYGITFQEVTSFVAKCVACQNFKPLKTLQDITMVQSKRKYERYVIDCVDLRHYQEVNDGYKWILNIIDS